MIVSRDFERSVIELGVFERRAKSLALFIDRVLEGDPSLPDACRQFVRGGKRLRARLVLACAAPSGKLDSEPLLRAAAAIEFFHAASLIHDDIVDRSETRRGAPVMHRALGVRGASLGGWYLGQLAFALMAELPHTARQRFAEAGQAMSRGQLAEIVRAGDLSLLPEDRIEIMDQKTAAVFGLACELGGALSGADTVDCARLRHLGESFGMLFQIADDVDDLYASREELGRAPGADLAAGVISLLEAFALQSDVRSEVADMLTGAATIDAAEAVARCRALMRSSGALRAAYVSAERYAQSARGQLRVLRTHEGTAWVGSLVDTTLTRVERHLDAAH